MRKRQMYRRPVQVIALVLVFLVFDAMSAGFASIMIRMHLWVGLGFVSLLLAFCVFVTLRALLFGVLATPRGLVVRNLFSTHRIPWEDVDRISPASEDWAGAVAIVLRAGGSIRCGGLARARGEKSSRLDPIAASLDLRLTAAHLATTPHPVRNAPRTGDEP